MEKKRSKSIRNSLLRPLEMQAFVFTLAYWALIWYLDSYRNGTVVNFLYDFLGDRNYYSVFSQGRTTLFTMAVLLYVLMIVILCARTILKITGYVETIDRAVLVLPDSKAEIPDLPADLKNVEISLKDIQHSIYRNEQAAREAEQRKNDLVVYLAHDLKTPLTSVIGYLSLLEEAPELPLEQRAKYTQTALGKAYRLEELINEFFDITRFNLQSIELEHGRIYLSRMLRQIADEFYPVLEEKKLTSELNIAPDLVVFGDADKLERVFDNLLRNAVSYSYENTCIWISAEKTGGGVRIAFRNAGDQIPEQKLSRVFEKFFRLDSARGSGTGGAGLGLAIAKQIVELHGGTVTAFSSRAYTEFTVVLPG